MLIQLKSVTPCKNQIADFAEVTESVREATLVFAETYQVYATVLTCTETDLHKYMAN